MIEFFHDVAAGLSLATLVEAVVTLTFIASIYLAAELVFGG
jgi:hypothetical protein